MVDHEKSWEPNFSMCLIQNNSMNGPFIYNKGTAGKMLMRAFKYLQERTSI
jgi:hypothetical protein